MSTNKIPKTLFFFGAGASKPAGVGITSELVNEFKQFLDQNGERNLKSLVENIITSLESKELDIELLMTAVEKLLGRDNDPLLKFYDKSTFKISPATNIPLLQDKLKEFIQKATSVREDKVGYLAPLLSFLRPRTIFSVNYDTAIEQFCNVRRLRYTDGFEHEWNSKLFDDDSFDFHLYKIHGSIMWYKTNKNNYVKLPIPPEGKQKLIFGEEAMPLMLYPMQKWEFVEPLLEMLLKFKKSLEEYDFAIVVGYSFRDSHIVRIFQETARRNQNLTIILVSPSARNHYEEKLRFYLDENGNKTAVPSILEDRVLCLQYGFEDIAVKLKEITDKYTSARVFENDIQIDVIAGRTVNPTILLSVLAEVEFLDRADKIRDNVNWYTQFTASFINTSLMVTCFKLFTIAEIQGKKDSADYWLKKFVLSFNMLNFISRSRIRPSESSIEIPQYETFSGYSGTRNHIVDLGWFMQNQKKFHEKYFSDILKDLTTKIQLWIHHSDDIHQTGSMGYRNYHLKISEFYTMWLEGSTMPTSILTLASLLDGDDRIKDFKTNKTKVLESILEIESDIRKKIFEGEDNLHKYLLNKYSDRITDT